MLLGIDWRGLGGLGVLVVPGHPLESGHLLGSEKCNVIFTLYFCPP